MRFEVRDLAVGQIWCDCDRREHGQRLVQVLGFDERYVYVNTIQLPRARDQRALGRKHRILRRSFSLGSQGYSYVRDAVEGQPSAER